MNLPFKTLNELFQYFNSEEKAVAFMEKMRWPDGKIVCPKCGKRGAYRNCDFKTYTCREWACRNKFTVTVGTVMENTKLPLAKWFGAIWLITAHKKGISSCQLARDLGIGQKAAWFLNHRIREMILDKAPEKLQGVVSADETFVGGKFRNMNKTKRTQLTEGGMTNKVPVMGMMEQNGKLRLQVINGKPYKQVVRENVDKSAVLITDEHLGYEGLAQEYAGHFAVNHSLLEFIKDGHSTNNVEGAFSLLKRMILGIYHQVSAHHLHRYCDEASYRLNTRKVKDWERFIDAMKKTKGRLKYKDLIMPKPKKYGPLEFVNADE